MVRVGRIVRPHGLKGDVVVESATDFGEARFRKGATVSATRGGWTQPMTIAASRPQGDRWVVRFTGVESVEQAEALRDAVLSAPETARPALPAGSYYFGDLVGCDVVTERGDVVGRVARVYDGAAQAVLGVEGLRGEVLIPLAQEICREVDVTARRIVIAPPAGLLEANETGGGRDH